MGCLQDFGKVGIGLAEELEGGDGALVVVHVVRVFLH